MASLNSDSITGITTTIFDHNTAVNKTYVDNNIPTVPSAEGQEDKVLVSVDGSTLVWREISSSFEYTTAGTHTFNVPDISTLFYVEAMSGGEGGAGASDGTIEPTTWSRRTINSYYPYGPYAFGYDASGNALHALAAESTAYVWFSTDFAVWTLRTMYSSSAPWVAYANNLWFGGGYERLQTSTDTIHWTMRTVNGIGSYSGPVTDVLWDGSYYIILGGEGSSPRMNASTDAIHWVMRTGPDSSHSQYYRNIKKQGSLYVLFTGNGYIATSTDGIAWTKRTAAYNGGGNNDRYRGLNYDAGNSIWLSPYSSYLRASTDAIHWALRTAGNNSSLFDSATNNNGVWILVGNSGYKATSTDTIHWTHRTENTAINGRNYFTAGYGGGKWSWYGQQNTAESSQNLGAGAGGAGGNYASWFIPKSLVTSSTIAINVGSGGTGNTVNNITNNPGTGTTISWTGPGGSMSVTSKSGLDVTQEDDMYFYSAGSASSTDQSKPNQATGGGAGAFVDTGDGDNGGQISYQGITTFAAGGQDAPKTVGFSFGSGGGGGNMSAATYPAWTLRTSGHEKGSSYGGGPAAIYGVGYAYDQWLAAGPYNSLSVSTDTIHWARRTSGYSGANFNFGFAYDGNSTLALGCENGQLSTSTDAIHFTKRTTGVPKVSSNFYALHYLNNNFLSGHQNAQLQVSTDAIHWLVRTSAGDTTKDIQSFAYGAGKYVFGNGGGQIVTSTDTIHWTKRTIGRITTNIRGLTYGSSQYVAAGDQARISTSTDAIHWTTRTAGLSSTVNFGEVVYSGGLYHIVQHSGPRIISSTDAIHWTLRTSNTSSNFFSSGSVGMVTNGTGEYIAGGSNGLISYLSYTSGTTTDGGNGFRGGGGGGGACSSDGSQTTNGGDGGDGYVKITWY